MDIQIIAGFRGSGKTTFLNQYIPYLSGKTVLIQNDYGAQELDTGGKEVKVYPVAEGCICCTMLLDFLRIMDEIVTKDQPEHLLIEAAGTGKVSDIIQACRKIEEETGYAFSYGRTLTVVDVPTVEAYAEGLGEFFLDQIDEADALLLNYIDMEDADEEDLISGKEFLQQRGDEKFLSEKAEAMITFLKEECL